MAAWRCLRWRQKPGRLYGARPALLATRGRRGIMLIANSHREAHFLYMCDDKACAYCLLALVHVVI